MGYIYQVSMGQLTRSARNEKNKLNMRRTPQTSEEDQRAEFYVLNLPITRAIHCTELRWQSLARQFVFTHTMLILTVVLLLEIPKLLTYSVRTFISLREAANQT